MSTVKVKLSQEQRHEYAMQVTELNSLVHKLENEEKERAKEARQDMAKYKRELNRLAEAARTGEEEQDAQEDLPFEGRVFDEMGNRLPGEVTSEDDNSVFVSDGQGGEIEYPKKDKPRKLLDPNSKKLEFPPKNDSAA